MRSESNPISDETLALIKEKRRRRRQYSQNKVPAVKTHINQLQKQVKEELGVEHNLAGKNSATLLAYRSIQASLGAKSRTSSSLRISATIQHCATTTKSPRQTPIKQLFAKSVERHFSIESEHFDSNHFNEVSKFIEDNHRYFYPPEDPDDYRFDVGNDHKLVDDVDSQSLIH